VQLIRERIPAYCQIHRPKDETIFDTFLNAPDLGFQSQCFVASLSQDADSLPQWRSYCPHGNGVAVGFRVDCLKRAFVEPKGDVITSSAPEDRPGVTYKKVEYLDPSRKRPLDLEIGWAIQRSMLTANNPKAMAKYPPADFFKIFIERAAYFIKHPSFSNEHEYRLLVDGVFPHREYTSSGPHGQHWFHTSPSAYLKETPIMLIPQTRFCRCLQAAWIL
jgi:hypothetical protein